jgi:pectin methylesterase-like acyl-CoA thioesterase
MYLQEKADDVWRAAVKFRMSPIQIPNPSIMPKSILSSGHTLAAVALGIVLTSMNTLAGTIFWNGPATQSTANNWSAGGNWTPNAPATSDDVKFYNAGGLATVSNINNTVDASTTIGSLQFGATNLFYTTLIASGQTLAITNIPGLLVVAPGDANQNVILASVKALTNWVTITGAGGALVLTNPSANLIVNQGSISNIASRSALDLSGLDTFTANVNRVAVGTTTAQNPGGTLQREQGILYLAKTNFITINYSDTLANYQTSGKTNAIEISRNPGNNPGAPSSIYLGQSNVINVDSLGVGMDKSGNNASAASGVIAFNPALAGSSPVAVFRGITGGSSRVTWWAVGDANASSSSSNGGRGTNDFTLGYIDAMINVLSLGRECNAANTGFGGPHSGVFSFSAGTVDVNTVYAGNQAFGQPTSAPGCLGVINVGSTALLKVNTALVLGQTVVNYAPSPGGSGTNAYRTSGVLNVTNGGTVWANTVIVGTNSVTNILNLASGMLIVSNSLATNASGLFALNMTNGTLGFTVSSNGFLRGLAQTLNTVGATNLIQLDARPVFLSSYPQQIPLIRYTTWTGSNVFGLTNLPAWAVGAALVSNGPNHSLDLSLPSDPRPVITAQPSAYSGNPGDNLNFAVTIAGSSVTPLGYQWYFVTNGVTNALVDGSGPSGSSTLAGSTSSATLLITNAQPGDNGNYFVVVTNAYGSKTSSLALLTISPGAIVPTVSGPTNVIVTNGVNGAIANSVSGSPVPAVYWLYNGTLLVNGPGPSGSSTISGANTATLSIANPQYPGDQGTYSCIASNSAGMATNNTVLSVIVPPSISAQPAGLVVTNTQTASFTVTASGVPNPTYQWYKNGAPISSVVNNTATNATFTIASASASDSSTNYYVIISNAAGSTNSAAASLTVNSVALTVASLAPANNATNICYDTPLYLTFSQAPTLRNTGKIRIYNANNTATPVDTIDLGASVTANLIYAANIQPYNIGGDTITNFPVIINGNTAAIYPHHGILTSNQSYYVTLDNGTFADSTGAYFIGISASNVWYFSTKVAGPANPTNLVVAANGSGDFLTVQGAIDSVPANNTTPTTINVRNGFYTEELDVKSKNNLDFRGQSRAGTFIGYPNNNWVNGNGAPNRSMCILNGNNCTFENLTITNTTPAGGSQAEAVDVEGSFASFLNMELDSYQDTFLVHSAGKLVYFQDCLIQGQTDFNWGYGTVYYTNCVLNCLLSGGHVTQPRSPYTTNGFGFINCRITQGYAGAATFDLGRTIGTPTSPSEVLFYNCLMADVVTGYASDAGTNMADYSCSNLTATAVKSLTFSTHSGSSDPFVIAIQSAPTWLYGWQPQVAPNILTNHISQTVNYSSNATFTVAATGVPTPTYQWQHAGTNLPTATSATLTVSSATSDNAGNYAVIVTTAAGSVTSATATLTVNPPPNTPPVFTAPPTGTNITINVGVSLAVSCTATDSDTPAQTLTYSLLAGPSGSAVDSASGNFTWRPTAAFAGTMTNVQVVVTDNGTPNLSATNSFSVTVNPLTAPTTSAPGYSGGQFSVSISGQVGPDYELQGTTNLTGGTWTSIATTNSPATMPVILTDPNAGSRPQMFYRIIAGPPLP